MLSKLLKYDLRKNMRWMWILFVVTLSMAGVTRGISELSSNSTFFKVLNIFFDSILYALVANCIIQPFVRGFFNFSKSLYGDESYLAHTLPVTKNQIINSKFLTSLIETLLGFACAITSLLIRLVTPKFFTTLKMMLSMVVSGNFSLGLLLTLIIVLIIVEFLMFLSIIYFSIVLGYRFNERKVLKAFLFTALFSLCASQVLSIVMVAVLMLNGVDLTKSTMVLSSSTVTSIILTGIIVYSCIIILFYLLTKILFRKGVNVD